MTRLVLVTAAVALAASGCMIFWEGGSSRCDARRTTVAEVPGRNILNCPTATVQTTVLGGNTFEATGCGRRVQFVHCPDGWWEQSTDVGGESGALVARTYNCEVGCRESRRPRHQSSRPQWP